MKRHKKKKRGKAKKRERKKHRGGVMFIHITCMDEA